MLTRRGIPVSDHNSLDINDGMPPFSQWRVEEEVLSLTAEEQRLLPDGWTVEPFELVSRKFYHDQDDWRQKIFTVLNALKELEAHGVKFITNTRTGFHVHVGFAEDKVPLRAAKNVFLFTTAFESLFDELHAAPRIAIPWATQERHHCYPLSFFAAKCGHGNSIFERLLYIERANSYEQIGAAFFVSEEKMGTGEICTGHNSAVNFDNLFPNEELGRHAETLTGTIEFRQHAGTLDYNAIVAWIETTVGIVGYAEECAVSTDAMASFADLLARAASGSVGWGELACGEHLLVPREVGEYYAALKNGTLVLPSPQTTNAHAQIVPLISANWARTTADSSCQLVNATIGEKLAHGIYGHDPSLAPFEVKAEIGSKLMAHLKDGAEMMGVEDWGPEDLSLALQWVFGELARGHSAALDAACKV